jgi:hypothetical protein
VIRTFTHMHKTPMEPKLGFDNLSVAKSNRQS